MLLPFLGPCHRGGAHMAGWRRRVALAQAASSRLDPDRTSPQIWHHHFPYCTLQQYSTTTPALVGVSIDHPIPMGDRALSVLPHGRYSWPVPPHLRETNRSPRKTSSGFTAPISVLPHVSLCISLYTATEFVSDMRRSALHHR